MEIMMTQLLMQILLVGNLSPSLNIVVPDNIFNVYALHVDGQHYYFLDKGSGALAKTDASGQLIASVEGKGQGPGKFFIPRSLAVSDDKVYVGDFERVHIFDKNLEWIKQVPMVNNPIALIFWEDHLYVGTHQFPEGNHGVHVYDAEARFVRSFYEHGLGSSLVMPYLAIDGQSRIFVLDRIGYNISIWKTDGSMVRTFPIKVSPRYKPYVSPDPYTRKYGYTLAASKHWRTQWSEPVGVKVVGQRYLMACFKELADLKTPKYYLDVYDLTNDAKIINWREMAGPLLFADDQYAYFVEEENTNTFNYRNFIVAYQLDSHLNLP